MFSICLPLSKHVFPCNPAHKNLASATKNGESIHTRKDYVYRRGFYHSAYIPIANTCNLTSMPKMSWKISATDSWHPTTTVHPENGQNFPLCSIQRISNKAHGSISYLKFLEANYVKTLVRTFLLERRVRISSRFIFRTI